MKKSLSAVLLPVCAAVLVAGCTVQHGPAQNASSDAAQSMQLVYAQTNKDMDALRSRLQRVERAMIRLDRRMQLIERNALSSMGDGGATTTPADPDINAMFRPMSFKQQQPVAPKAVQPQQQQRQFVPVHMQQKSYGMGRGAGLQQVGYQKADAGQITSALQAGDQRAKLVRTSAIPMSSAKALSSLPSLADEEKKSEAEASVAIWTIDYDMHKIWPDRSQLTGSREVVEALRSEDSVALFARGVRPASREFRERVRAISRYLGRVAGKDSLPIASMPAEHLNGDTIEIIATK